MTVLSLVVEESGRIAIDVSSYTLPLGPWESGLWASCARNILRVDYGASFVASPCGASERSEASSYP